MEEASEPIESEEIEREIREEEEARRQKRARALKIAAIVVSIAVAGAGGGGVWYLFFSNSPPTADFTVRAVDLRVVVDASNSTDPDGNIVNYTWDWGDGTPRGFGLKAAHTYAEEQSYTISLVATDARAASNSRSRSITVQVFPVAHFIARHEGMTVDFDASGSFHALGEPIISYAWEFGDGATEQGLKVTHRYTEANRHTVKLNVTDARGRWSIAQRYVSPNSTTVDILADQFFAIACPYRDYWDARYNSYGDQILRNQQPCTDYYPWVLYSSAVELQKVNPSYVYTLYRWDARVRNHFGYSVAEPVILPIFNSVEQPLPTSYIEVNLTFEYLDTPFVEALRGTPWSVSRKYYSDGFGYLLRGDYTMDLAMAKRIFGMRGVAGAYPSALDVSGAGRKSDGADWSTLPSLPALPSAQWVDLVVTSDNTALAIATDSTVYRLTSGGTSWNSFISPPTAGWSIPRTNVVAIAADHEDTLYAITEGNSTSLIPSQLYRSSSGAPGGWSLVANLSLSHSSDTGGIADLAHARGLGATAVLYALSRNARFPRDPVAYSAASNLTVPPEWTAPRNAFASENRYTNASLDGAVSVYGNYRIAGGPVEPYIHQVEVGIEGKTTGDDDVRVEFSTDGGSTWTSAGIFSPVASDSTAFFDVTSLRSWNFTALNDTNLRTRIAYVQVGSGASLVSVDWTPVRVRAGNATLLRSVDGGGTWASIGAAAPADVLMENAALAIGTESSVHNLVNWTLAVPSPSAFHILLANGSVQRTTDGGSSWSWISKSPGSPSGSAWRDLTWDGRNGLWALAETASGVEAWRYEFLGRTWTNVTGSIGLTGVAGISSADPQQWWHANTAFARDAGALEARFASWLERQGNGKYDVFNGFEWFYETDITDLVGTVAPDGNVTVSIFADGWGLDTLQARWFYWGKADYQAAVCAKGYNTQTVVPPLVCEETRPFGAIKPQGWMPMETCWCEHQTMKGKIQTSLDLDFVGIQGYHFEAWANFGSDGVPRTGDDLPAWVFQPFLMDYVPGAYSSSAGASGFPNSELRWFEIQTDTVREKKTAYHMAPGSYGYGTQLEFLISPVRWPLNQGSTLTLVMPRFEVPWYDPVRSVWDPDTKIGDYWHFMSTMDLRLVRPAGDYFLWDARAKVLSIAGPFDWPGADDDLPFEGWPFIEFGPETVGSLTHGP